MRRKQNEAGNLSHVHIIEAKVERSLFCVAIGQVTLNLTLTINKQHAGDMRSWRMLLLFVFACLLPIRVLAVEQKPSSDAEVLTVMVGGLVVFALGWIAAKKRALKLVRIGLLAHLIGMAAGAGMFFLWMITVFAATGKIWPLFGVCVAALLACWWWLREPEPEPEPEPELKSEYKATPEQLEQIELARQSSLATLRELDRRKAAKEREEKRLAKASKPAPMEPIHLPDRIEFTYKGADSKVSRRVVMVKKADHGGGKITGWCETSGALKTFRVDRIQGGVVRHETGEIADPFMWFGALRLA